MIREDAIICLWIASEEAPMLALWSEFTQLKSPGIQKAFLDYCKGVYLNPHFVNQDEIKDTLDKMAAAIQPGK